MAFSAVAFIAPNYRDFKNYWLKAYNPGTTTPKVMALDNNGTVQVAKLQLNANGFIVSAGQALVVPYIDGPYDLWLFPTSTEAGANNTSNAKRVADNIEAIGSAIINDLSQDYIFDTVADFKGSTIEFPDGKTIHLNDRDADFIKSTGNAATPDEDVIFSTNVNQSVTLITKDTISPHSLGAQSYTGLYVSETSSTSALNRAYQLSYEKGVPLSGGQYKKYFMDGPLLINRPYFAIDHLNIEYLPAYAGVALHIGADQSSVGIQDSVASVIKVQTTLEDSPTATRTQKEGSYIGVLHDTALREIFNVHISSLFLGRPKVGLQWANNDGGATLNDWSTTCIYDKLSILGYETAVQVLANAGIVGEQQLNSPIFLQQRSVATTLFDIQKGTSFMVNDAFYWNDGALVDTLFNITGDSRMSMVTIKGGYWEAQASDFINSQASIDGNFKLTTKPGGIGANDAVIFQPNITGGQTSNLVTVEPINWVVTAGTIIDNGDSYQSRPMYNLDGVVRYDIGWEDRFKDLQNLTFSCWIEPDTIATAGLAIQVNYTDATTDNFNSAFVIFNGEPQLVGVDISPTGLSAGKVPNRILVTITSGSGKALVGIPVINLGATMPLYPVPLLAHLSKERYRTLAVNDTAPSLRSTYSYFVKTENTVATTLVDFQDGVRGQELFVLVKDTNTSVDFTGSSNIRGHNPTGGVSVYLMANTDALRCIKEPDGQWYCTIVRSSG
jgi:hypothetical protein